MSIAKNPITSDIPIIDYEGSNYKSDFWIGQGREYEDRAERFALNTLLPTQGGRIAEIGAGFGRLADQYLGYEQIILFDYSRSLLKEAVAKWGHDPRFIFVAGNIYQLPLATGILDSLVMVRVMHHLADVATALQELARTLHTYSVSVFEYANKRNMKAIARWLLGKQFWSPFERDPIEFVELNYDFHPLWMEQTFASAALKIDQQLAVSHFRLPFLKKYIAPENLAKLDRKLFRVGGNFPIAPSVFVQSTRTIACERSIAETSGDGVTHLFRCPICTVEEFITKIPSQLVCRNCNARFAKKDGVWDFKDALKVD